MPSSRAHPEDSVQLDPKEVALHQAISLESGSQTWIPALSASPLFQVRITPRGFVAEWARAHAEGERFACPFGMVTIVGSACLLEAWSDARMKRLRRTLESTTGSKFSPDESLVLSLEDAVRRPGALLEVRIGSERGEATTRTRREVAEAYVRGAWAFVPRAELHGRLPVVVARTERGRRSIEAIAAQAVIEIKEKAPTFPPLTPEEIAFLMFEGQDRKPTSRVRSGLSMRRSS